MTAVRHIIPAIRHLRRHEIDITRWDECIGASTAPLIYGNSYFLDRMAAGQWDALILDDYQAVLPLTWRSKYGIRYCYQPAFTQQTGIFSAQAPGAGLVEAFLRQLDRQFRFAEIHLNYSNVHPSLAPRTNYILSLDQPYGQLASGYKKDLVRNLKLTRRTPLRYMRDHDRTSALHAFRQEYAAKMAAIKKTDYDNFESLCEDLQKRQQLLIRAVADEKRQVLASAVFLRDTHRFYLIHSTTLPAGRTTEANHFLLDQFIREWAGSSMILDFEGSDHPGIAHFYGNFGAVDQPYFSYRRNGLPWPVRWLK